MGFFSFKNHYAFRAFGEVDILDIYKLFTLVSEKLWDFVQKKTRFTFISSPIKLVFVRSSVFSGIFGTR